MAVNSNGNVARVRRADAAAESDVELAPGIAWEPGWSPPGPTPLELAAAIAAGLATALSRPLLEGPVLGALGGLLAERPGPQLRRRVPPASEPAADPGWFGPDSVAWRVHADTAVFVAGVTAFTLQALHPLALAGVADHSSFAQDFMGRTRRTGEFVAGVTYGTGAQADALVARVKQVHRRVAGTAPDGRHYSADAPDLLEWVHVTEYLAIAAAYRRFALRPLSDDDLDRYIDEVAVAGSAMGVVSPPRSWAELDRAFQRFRPAMAVGEQAQAAVAFLRSPPGLPAAARPVWRLFVQGSIVCLPPVARRLLGLGEPSVLDVAACRAAVRALGVVLGPPPPLASARQRLGYAGG